MGQGKRPGLTHADLLAPAQASGGEDVFNNCQVVQRVQSRETQPHGGGQGAQHLMGDVVGSR